MTASASRPDPASPRRARATDRAGGSAQAMARELRARERGRLLAMVAAGGLALGLLGLLLIGWRFGLVGALWGSGGVLVWQRRTGDAARWAKGAAGERRTARMLRPLERRGYVVLHDRSIPRSRANLDHLVIGPCGVIVVDSKNWAKDRVIKGRGRRLKVGRVGGKKVVGSATYERDRVEQELARALGRSVPVSVVLAIHGAKVSPFRPVATQGVPLLAARSVRRWITRQPDRLSAAEHADVAQACARLFTPYGATGTDHAR